MKGDQITLSTGTVVSLGLRNGSVVAHAKYANIGLNRGATALRPVTAEALATLLGLDWANMKQSDVTALTAAIGKLS